MLLKWCPLRNINILISDYCILFCAGAFDLCKTRKLTELEKKSLRAKQNLHLFISRQLFLTSFSNQCRQLSEFSPLDHSEVFDTSDQTILLMCLQHWLATSVLAVSLQQSIHCLYSNESSPAGYTYKPVLFHTPPFTSLQSHIPPFVRI